MHPGLVCRWADGPRFFCAAEKGGRDGPAFSSRRDIIEEPGSPDSPGRRGRPTEG
jgi:hypothetical protein